MNALTFLYVFVLFYVLTPGILVTLPKKSSKMVVALVHGLLFTLILALSYRFVASISSRISGLFEGMTTKKESVKPHDDKKKPSEHSK
jgi:hypothetical protein